MPGFPGMNGQMPQNMGDMMNNPMVKEMMNNPDMMKMAMNMMGGQAGANGQPGAPGGMDPSKMQELMQNPSIGKMIDNPELLQTTLGMLKNPAMRPQLEQIAKQVNAEPETLVRILDFLLKMVYCLKPVKAVVSNPIVKYGFIILVISYLLKWFGFTNDLLFMMPFKKGPIDDEE